MALHSEIRKTQNKWRTNSGWPKRLEWVEISGIRGWIGQRVDFGFPVVALVGENGAGKSTVLQAAASAYRSQSKREEYYASDFFPDTPFEKVTAATIRFSFREGNTSQVRTVRKPSDRWRGNPARPERKVEYIDLSRIQPVSARVGYSRLIKSGVLEGEHTPFENEKVSRLAEIVGRRYVGAGLSTTNIDAKRQIPVLSVGSNRYSGFHQGVGEISVAELLDSDFQKYSLILIDEVETSLHPRAQRRLMRDLCRIAREKELQIILTTHSPYVLGELPPEGRIYLMESAGGKSAVVGVSPDFAMTRMDEEQHPECDVYVEDKRSGALVSEILAASDRDTLSRVKIIPYGTASVGQALGQMAHQRRFPRPSVVFLDGDQAQAIGCSVLPGEDAPEQVVFDAMKNAGWTGIDVRIGRKPAETFDALTQAMTLNDHHDWVNDAANRLHTGGDILWQALCAEWARRCADDPTKNKVLHPVQEALDSAQ